MDCLILDLTDAPGEWGKVMLADMSAALATHGVAVTTILEPADADRRLADFMSALPPDRYFLLIDGNCRANKEISDPRAIRFSFIVDHPACRLKDFEGAKIGTLMGFVDESHLIAADRLGLPFPKFFFPHAGPPPDPTGIPLADRPVDVLVCCTFAEPLTDAEWRAEHPEIPAIVADALLEAADRLATSLTTSLGAWDEACAARELDMGGRLAPAELSRVLVLIEQLATARRRRDVLSGLADHVSMHVITPNLPSYLRDRPNIVIHGGLTFDQVQEGFRQAKVVINPVAKFAYGSHERIWYSIAHGCIVATDESHFMLRDFADGENLLILPWGAEQGEFRRRLVSLLQQPMRLDAMQQAARLIYGRHHSWYKRVMPLVELMQQFDRKVVG
jgi:hypothetical protein